MLIKIKLQKSTWSITCKVDYLTTYYELRTFLTQWVVVQEIILYQYYCNQQKNWKRFNSLKDLGSLFCLLIKIKLQKSTWSITCKVDYLTTYYELRTFLTQWVMVQEIILHQYYCNQQKNSKRFTFLNYLIVFPICWSTQMSSKVLEILLIIMCLMKKY